MISFARSLAAKSLIVLILLPILILAACGGDGSTTGGSNTPAASKPQIKLGSKKDLEARLLSTMYNLLLTKAGFDVKTINPGENSFVFNGIKNGDIDVYPEFTSTGLDNLKIKPSSDPQKDYETVKSEFAKQFQITWLDVASNLNDTYAICTTKARAGELGVTSISQVVPKLSQLTLALQADGLYVIDFLKPVYGIEQKSFKSIQKVDYSIGFKSVENKQADLNFCYSTDVTIAQKNFVVLEDDKKAFPAYNPAPIVRDSVLKANPKIADALNPLAPLLTNDVSLTLQKQALEKQDSGMSVEQSLKVSATDFLKGKGLL
jgi:osmoprotectant transport system substrate-binding protein